MLCTSSYLFIVFLHFLHFDHVSARTSMSLLSLTRLSSLHPSEALCLPEMLWNPIDKFVGDFFNFLAQRFCSDFKIFIGVVRCIKVVLCLYVAVVCVCVYVCV